MKSGRRPRRARDRRVGTATAATLALTTLGLAGNGWAAGATTVTAGCPGAPTIACYAMQQPSGAAQYDLREAILPGTNSVGGAIDPATTTGVVSARNARTYYFSGWGGFVRRGGSGWQLSPDAAGQVTLPETFGQVLVDRTGITDPTTSFNPGTRDWRLKVRFEPELLRFGAGDFRLPDRCLDAGCTDMAHPSYNIVQKGRNGPGGPVGGFYKVELMGYDGNDHGLAFTKGSVHCVFTDDDGTSVEAFSGVGAGAVLVGTKSYYTVDCLRVGSGVKLKVTDDATAAVQRVNGTMTLLGRITSPAARGDGVLDTVAPANLAGSQYSPLLAIGKKPMSTNPADAFRGWIDYVSLSDH